MVFFVARIPGVIWLGQTACATDWMSQTGGKEKRCFWSTECWGLFSQAWCFSLRWQKINGKVCRVLQQSSGRSVRPPAAGTQSCNHQLGMGTPLAVGALPMLAMGGCKDWLMGKGPILFFKNRKERVFFAQVEDRNKEICPNADRCIFTWPEIRGPGDL